MELRALIFDFDGLILDTETSAYESARETFAAHGLQLSREWWQGIIGGADHPHWLDVLCAEVAGPLDRTRTQSARDQRKLDLLATEVVRPGVSELLAEAGAAGLPCAVASSSPADWVVPHLERLGLRNCFEVVVCRDDVGHEAARTKPAPDLFALAVERLDVPADAAVVLEDSPTGVRAAVAAGICCVAVPCGLTCGLAFPGAASELPTLAGCTLADLDALLVAHHAARTAGHARTASTTEVVAVTAEPVPDTRP